MYNKTNYLLLDALGVSLPVPLTRVFYEIKNCMTTVTNLLECRILIRSNIVKIQNIDGTLIPTAKRNELK